MLFRSQADLTQLLDDKKKRVKPVAEAANQRSKLYTVDDETAETICAKLRALMQEEKVYKESNLTLVTLAEHSGYPTRSVSEVINACFEKNFYQFVSDYRIEEVKQRLSNPHETESVLSIAGEAGFVSKSSFNTFFKKTTGMTPSAYRRSKNLTLA